MDDKELIEAFRAGDESAFEELVSEAALHPRMMSVGMHARILGQPGRIVGLRAFLDHIEDRDDVWICRRGDLAAHWRAEVPPPEAHACL